MAYITQLVSSQTTLLMLFIYSVALFFVFLENVNPQATYPASLTAPRQRFKRWLRNSGFYAVNVLLSPFYEVLPLLIIAHLSIAHPLANNPFYIIFAILLLDLSLYIAHWLNHNLRIFWAFHRIHHMDEFLDTTTAFRFHLFEILQTVLVRSLIIVLLGINPKTITIYIFISALILIYEHTNVKTNPYLEKIINLVFVTPNMHWVHHNATLPETNTNYSIIFSFWDRLFGTLSPTVRSNKTVVGLATIPDQAIVKLVFFPFIKTRTKNLLRRK